MPFYDRVSDTVKQVGQKAGELVDVTRLNAKISENNKRINSLYTEIGEIYFSLHKSNPDKRLAQQVAEVSELQDQNQKWNGQIQTLHGLVECPQCHNYVAKNIMFCTACGARLLPETSVICPQCHAVADQGMTFCPSCGFRLPNNQEQERGTGSAKVRCSVCGTEFGPNDMFCTNCGTPRPASGSSNAQQADLNKVRCSVCGTEFGPDDMFCTNCGTPRPATNLSSAKTVPPENEKTVPPEDEEPEPSDEEKTTPPEEKKPEPPKEERTTPPEEKKPEPDETENLEEPTVSVEKTSGEPENASGPATKICPHCGTKQAADTLFCMECGAKF